MTTFLKDPKNLRYRLSIVVPGVAFLTSILTAVTMTSLKMSLGQYYTWLAVLAIFSALCSLAIIVAMTSLLKDLVAKAEDLVHIEKVRSDRGLMIEVYQLIEKLMELAKARERENRTDGELMIEGIERLDYLLPLGYMSLMVAHEVRNPLNTITGMNELLKAKTQDPQLQKYAQVSLDAAKKIDTFTKELLDFTDDEVSTEDFDVNDVVAESVKGLSYQFNRVTCDFDKGNLPTFSGDRNKIYQAVNNILKNAFEYELEGGYVKVATAFDRSILISIYNRSSRVEQAIVQTIFKPFFTKKKGGRGIGLFIAMRNVKMHGGNIDVTSGDSGTIFTITLPVTK
ncbi:MAG: Sensor protein ZraS [Syntrophorhabdus sp. PtaU1.Bin153]|nr:MAG: Sensor protein ZraS [Syntrophorhabdus sp. PtaU1.Bin153]